MKINIEKVARAIDIDTGERLSELREALKEANTLKGRVTTPVQIILRQTRAKTGLSQSEFAERIATPVATLRDWEQGRFTPPGGVMCLIKLNQQTS